MALSRHVKVGLFVLVGLTLTTWIIFMIGEESLLFERKITFHADFTDVRGLKRGAPVTMGGVNVGTVSAVGYSHDLKDPMLHVTVLVSAKEAHRVKTDTLANIEPKGLLGDQMVVLRGGEAASEALPAGGKLEVNEGGGLGELLGRAKTLGSRAEVVMTNLEKFSTTLADPKFQSDILGAAHSLSHLMKSLDSGEGYAAKLINDKAEGERISHTVRNLEESSEELSKLLGSTHRVMARVENGPGFAHELLYGQGAGDALAKFGGAADEVQKTLKGVREGNGLARGLLFGGDDRTAKLVANMETVSDDLRTIVHGVKTGKGTLGALLVDPSVYEDLKLLLGNVGRNRSLRALVRYSIRADEKAPKVQVKDPSAPAKP